MKRMFIWGFIFLSLGLVLNYKEEILGMIIEKSKVSFEYKNNYYLDYNFNYVQEVDSFKLDNKKDLVDLYYTIINNGNNNFEFYCPNSYVTCVDDIIYIANNQYYLSFVNGFVHPFNSFDTVETTYDTFGRIKVKIVKTYTDVEIEKLNAKVEEIAKDIVKDVTDKKEIIRIIHDYIIDNTKYDQKRAEKNIITYASNTAYGVLFEGYGICSGYADAMALFLNYYKIPNYKISSENHVWNAVFLDGEWLHLDLTWDDPVTSSKEDLILHDYFLITTDELLNLDKTQHSFNTDIYSELKETLEEKI